MRATSAVAVASLLAAFASGCKDAPAEARAPSVAEVPSPALIRLANTEVGQVVALVAPFLPKNPVILEGGAYDGENSLLLAAAWPEATIHSFEPVPALFARVKARVAGNPNVRPYELALSDKSGSATFHLSEDASQPDVPSQSGSLLAPKEHLKRAPYVAFKKKISVTTTTIDDWAAKNGIDHVDFLYLDIQGAELAAMKGAPRIMKTVKAIKAEVEFVEAYANQAQFRDVRDWLKSQGFRMVGGNFDPANPSRPDWVPADGARWFGDAIFVRP